MKTKRVWHKHREFVRRLGCCVPDCENTNIEFAHIRTAANSGIGIKPPDWFGVGLCQKHHVEQHNKGQRWFELEYGIDLLEMAFLYATRSSDKEMIKEMKRNILH